MKSFRILLCLALSVPSFTTIANSEQLVGAWKCSTALPISWLDALSIYLPDGSFTGVASSITETKVHEGNVNFDLFLVGSWSLNGKELTTNIINVEVVPKNPWTEKEIELLKETVNQPSLLDSVQEVLLLTNDKLRTRSENGAIDNCVRAISASELRTKSKE